MNAKALKLRLFFALGDVFHLCFSFLLSYRLVFYTIDISEKYLFLLIILCLSWLLIGSFFRLFDYGRAARTELMLSNLLKAFIVNVAEQHHLAVENIASKKQINQFLTWQFNLNEVRELAANADASSAYSVDLLTGWRNDLFGQTLQEFANKGFTD